MQARFQAELQLCQRCVSRYDPGLSRTISPSDSPRSGYRAEEQKISPYEIRETVQDVRVLPYRVLHHPVLLLFTGVKGKHSTGKHAIEFARVASLGIGNFAM